MMYHFSVTGPERKKLASLIGEIIGQAPKYLGVPSCAYQIGTYNLSKDGVLTWSDLDDADPAHMDESCSLIQKLEESGYRSEEADFVSAQEAAMQEPDEFTGLTISFPAAMFDEAAIENLKRLVTAKGELMRRAFQCDDLKLEVDEEKVSFPWFPLEGPDETKAYTSFVKAISQMSIEQSRISAKEKEIVNEKYEFRCFLLRLGMIGDEYKQARKILMKNLSGSAAFKSGKKGGEQE